ncbi:HlyD family efflux transporter periplasmic adaptor subunit [Rhizobium sp. SSA_523]|uniref:HlyD family secretion protein n=1 Tax=Rhizobium sp. SSA_523 TaxID=2952477 RepID=UPI0020918055|nr:HlyD family efflux transporter periplasmic adaptor subunit [Rhizobium sp. SSA_523]MCO5732449.1 HlyD family secretion protein [Rhizobium sp. SSA_523]WKC22408.1 HlyD family efflux transporter periplasmic adaptor subunit [Rhizobium sp. SSA_523]
MPAWPRLLDRLRDRTGSHRSRSAMSHFEMAGLHDLSSTIELRRDTASTVLAAFFASLAGFILLALFIGSFAKQETMRGIVLGTQGGQRITATVDGTIARLWVTQGEEVKAGQRLLTILPQQTASGSVSLSQSDLTALSEQSATVKKQIDSLQAVLQRDDQDLAKFDENLEALKANLWQQEKDLVQALSAQDEIVGRLRAYLKQGYTTRETLATQERLRQDYLQQLASVRLQTSQLAASSIERRRSVMLNTTSSRSQLAELRRLQAELRAKIERARTAIATDIIAATDGQVVALNVREGSAVTLGDTVAAIGNPDAPFVIGLQAPSKTMGLLQIGQRVVLKYDAFPYKTFGVQYGRLIAISAQPMSVPKPDEQAAAPVMPAAAQAAQAAPAQSKYLVEVEPERRTIMAYGKERPILIGSTLSADVVVEKRRLIDWVLDPVLAMRGRL